MILLILGPSGVGKSELIRLLCQSDPRIVSMKVLVSRDLRPGEVEKEVATLDQIQALHDAGELLMHNKLYGVSYATPVNQFVKALERGLYPIIDWPVEKVPVVQERFPSQVCSIYLEPPSLEELERRLQSRDYDGNRLSRGRLELGGLRNGEYDHLIDIRAISHSGRLSEIAAEVYSMLAPKLGKGSHEAL